MQNNYQSEIENPVIIIGGGPSGLTAAHELTRHHLKPIVFERLDKVGGLSRTENFRGYLFDMGGHRFITKSAEVNAFWHELMGDEFLRRPRLSRIYYNNRFFNYPFKPLNALIGLGPLEGLRIVLSYLRWQIFPHKKEETFEQWVTNRFGKRLFQTFFESYTEKVWGIPCSELKAEWAAQRIKDLSLKTAITSMFLSPRNTIRTLIEDFEYPRCGPGMLWTRAKEVVESRGGTVHMNSDVVGINREGNRITSIAVQNGCDITVVEGSNFISSMPVTMFLKRLAPPPPARVLEAANQLRYRDFLTVCLIINKKELFPDNWIYIHDPNVMVGRIQNFKNWSADMVPDVDKTSLGLEYFCNEGDELWNMTDEALVELAKTEIEKTGLANHADVEDGAVFRVDKSYPVYDSDYKEALEVIKQYISSLQNFHTIGRNGLHRYNNQDHAMLTGMYAVRNMLNGESTDLWQINAEEEYHEVIYADEKTTTEDVIDMVQEALTHVFPKLDAVSFGFATGIVAGSGLFLATLFLVVKGGDVVGPNLRLLDQFFFGYTVSGGGSLVGLLYGFIAGFAAGWGVAFLRNTITALYLASIYRSAERSVLSNLLDMIDS